MIKYRQILGLKISHEYFTGAEGQYLTLSPTPATSVWFQREGILFRFANNMGHLFLSDTVDLLDLARQDPGFILEFNIQSQDPHFLYYTYMPLDEIGQLEFFIPADSQNDSSGIRLDSRFVPSDPTNGVVAKARIGLKVLATYPTAPQFEVHFQNRSVRWKYFIINQTDKIFDQLQLQGRDKDLFLDARPTELPTGITASLFDSGANRIPLKSNGNIDLRLVGIMGNGGSSISAELIERLPNAAPDHLQIDKDAEPGYYSAIYVYL